tara:strand:- start:139 stop:660 length:522 start_codon:yes stop_codon:yes gene_type:complete
MSASPPTKRARSESPVSPPAAPPAAPPVATPLALEPACARYLDLARAALAECSTERGFPEVFSQKTGDEKAELRIGVILLTLLNTTIEPCFVSFGTSVRNLSSAFERVAGTVPASTLLQIATNIGPIAALFAECGLFVSEFQCEGRVKRGGRVLLAQRITADTLAKGELNFSV